MTVEDGKNIIKGGNIVKLVEYLTHDVYSGLISFFDVEK